ncbi:MAG: hypothetical protein J6M39_01150 [Lachnospiraceae bacterium]|nr:hypothetical protein [Lachnospiraceae bacterium]
MKNVFKKIFILVIIIAILLLLTFINQNYIKNDILFSDDLYKNELSEKINNNDIDDINYDFLYKDLNSIDDILKEQLNSDIDRLRKTKYYAIAENIYSNKINEITRILTDKLDDEDFLRLQLDLEEFQKNIDFAISDLEKNIESSVELDYYKNKYMYEEKQKKCRDILETYKGFLQ